MCEAARVLPRPWRHRQRCNCVRVYNAAYANGTNSLCDLVDSAAPTTAICTLRVKTNGLVDLTGVTPATKCSAATGGVCNVSKIYDQAGSTGGFIQTTAGNQAKLSFNALNSLPGIACTSAAATSLSTSGSVTLPQPFSISTVAERNANFTTQGTWLGALTNNLLLGPSTSANNWFSLDPSGSSSGNVAANDSVFHAAQGVYPTTGGTVTLSVDGVSHTGTAGSGGVTTARRFCRQNGALSPDGFVMEGGFWPIGFSGTQTTNLNANQHSLTNGYNF